MSVALLAVLFSFVTASVLGRSRGTGAGKKKRNLQDYYTEDFEKLQRLSDESPEGAWDVIIVGGGTSGVALAARLSEDKNIKVLVLEAGRSGHAFAQTRIPLQFLNMLQDSWQKKNNDYVPRYITTVQEQGGDRFWPRAKMVGGCSNINAMMAQHGHPSDFDEWAAITNTPSFGWSSFGKYFRRLEDYRAREKNHYDDPAWEREGREFSISNPGPVTVGFFNQLTDLGRGFIDACIQLGIEYAPDFTTTVGTRGVNRIMTYIDEKRARVTAETAYFTPDVLSRPNLTVATSAHVTHVLTSGSGEAVKATGIEFKKSKGGKSYILKARKEIVLCGGALQTPQLLMLSGIGPKSELEKGTHGSITVVKDLPGVGKSLYDHGWIPLVFRDAQKGRSLKHMVMLGFTDKLKAFKEIYHYLTKQRGVLSSQSAEAAAFLRSDDVKVFQEQELRSVKEDTTSGPTAPDLELFVMPIGQNDKEVVRPDCETSTVGVVLLRPSSAGTLTLATTSSFDHPSIEPNYLKTQHDLDTIVRGLKIALRVSTSNAFGLKTDESSPEFDHNLARDVSRAASMSVEEQAKLDARLEALAKKRFITLYHPSCTCKMAPLDEGGVVGPDFKVHGVQGLRICDASVFPMIISGHTAGTCYALAEKLADEMKAEMIKN